VQQEHSSTLSEELSLLKSEPKPKNQLLLVLLKLLHALENILLFIRVVQGLRESKGEAIASL